VTSGGSGKGHDVYVPVRFVTVASGGIGLLPAEYPVGLEVRHGGVGGRLVRRLHGDVDHGAGSVRSRGFQSGGRVNEWRASGSDMNKAWNYVRCANVFLLCGKSSLQGRLSAPWQRAWHLHASSLTACRSRRRMCG